MGFSGRVKCIYIDPPYNTGNKDWVYNDHYFETNDRYRHSTWLEFLFRRVSLARDLLTEDGVILVSINDDNRARLDLLLEEALPGMRVGSFVWRTKDTANDADKNFSSVHEHVLIYGNRNFSFLGYELDDSKYRNPDKDLRGKYSSDPITQPKTHLERANGYYPIQDPDSGWWYPCSPDSVWRYASEKIETSKKKLRSETIEALIREKRIIFPAKACVEYSSREQLLSAIRAGTAPVDGNGRQLLRENLPDLDFWVGKPIALGRPSKKAFWEEKKTKLKPVSSMILGSNDDHDAELYELVSEKQGKATGEVQQIFGSKVFNYPKPSTLMRSLIQAVAGPGELVLDFFAGSATTAQAVMELNAEDGGERRFIMVSSKESTPEEPEKNLCKEVTAQRIRLLNASNDQRYTDLRADFAYLRTRKLDFENFDYDLSPAEVWNVLELIHDLPISVYAETQSWNEHSNDTVTLIYVDKTTDRVISRLNELLDQRRNLFVYSWAPGQIEQQMAGRNLEIIPVHEALVKRFQQ
jgi:adenine-specific DNA-methyltransferase